MIKNYIKIAIRNLSKQRYFALVNIVGLTLGLSVCATTLLYVKHELSYDNFHKAPDRTYRLAGRNPNTGWKAVIPLAYSNEIYKKEIPEIEKIARFRRTRDAFGQYQDEKFIERKVLITDPEGEFFDVFHFEFIEGTPTTALSNNNNVILTESTARKYFGEASALGKLMNYSDQQVTVGAVIEDVPSNSHMTFDLLWVSKKMIDQAYGTFTYCLLKESADVAQFKEKLLALEPATVNQYTMMDQFNIDPLRQLHFEGNYVFELKPTGNKTYLYIFILIGLIVLIISATNYMNLSLAIYTARGSEIGLRKVIGANKAQLFAQFITESVVLSLICFPLILLVLEFLLPGIKTLVGVDLHEQFYNSPIHLIYLLLLCFLTGLVSGIYPAAIIPRLNTIKLLKKQLLKSQGSFSLQEVLVTFQFVLLIGLGSAAWIANKQLQYFQSADLGFTEENVIKLEKIWALETWKNYLRLKNQLLIHPAIESVATGMVPGDDDYGYSYRGENEEQVYNDVLFHSVDEDYMNTLGIEILEDNYFSLESEERPASAIFINQRLAEKLQYENPIGRKIILYPGEKNQREHIIDGVVKDYNFFSLHQQVAPQILRVRKEQEYVGQNILIKAKTTQLATLMKSVTETWDLMFPHIPLQIGFLDEDIQIQYEKERRLVTVGFYLSVCTIFLAALGLIGLMAFMIHKRTKELGIRKVLGASTFGIVNLLTRDFLKLILIAILVASPMVYYFMDKWLQDFAYRIEIHWSIFIIVGGVALLGAFLTVSLQSVKAATANPIKSLRTE